MATFRTDPNTGRTVISESNRVDRPSDPGDLYSDRNRARSRPDFLSRDEFETASGMTDTNPYGNEGFFSRVFGIDPSKISYANNLGPQGIENVKIQAYDRYLNPFAKFDAFGRPTMGADASLGLTRSGVQPGDMTIYGPAIESQREGIAGLFENTMLGSLMPKQARIPGYDRNVLLPDLMAGPAVGGGTEPPGVPYFTSSTAPTRDAASVPEVVDREIFTTDLDIRNPESYFADINTRPQETPVTPGFTRPDDAMPTVSEVILGDLQGPPAFIETGRTPIRSVSRGGQPLEEVTGRLDYPGTANDRDAQGVVIAGTMRSPRNVAPSDNQRYVTVDGRLYDRELDEFLPAAPAVQQGIGAGDPGSASLTTRPGSETPTYESGDGQVDLITPFLPGMEDILNVPPRPQVDPRTGRIPGTSGTFNL